MAAEELKALRRGQRLGRQHQEMAGFDVSINSRIWVSTKAQQHCVLTCGSGIRDSRDRDIRMRPGDCSLQWLLVQ
jgi:hypothetical protein